MAWRKNLDEATKKKVAAALAEIKGLPWGERGDSMVLRPPTIRPMTWCARPPRR
jgi:hypothetical protein